MNERIEIMEQIIAEQKKLIETKDKIIELKDEIIESLQNQLDKLFLGVDPMRNASRIDPFCAYLAEVWKEHFPDWRFGQLISNLIDFYGHDPFYLEEDAFKNLINKYVEVQIAKNSI